MKNFLLGIIVAGLLGSAAFYLYQSGRLNPVLQQKDEVTAEAPTPLPSPSAPIADSEQDDDLIRAALFAKNNWKASDEIRLAIKTNDGKYASGLVNSDGGGGYFYAIKTNNEWKIVADGNGIIACDSLKDYPDYPTTLISSCYDEATQKIVKR